jgi:hypothetical protein
MSIPCPHFNKFLESGFDGFGSVLDVGVPDLIGGEAGHFQCIVFQDVDCHETLVVSVGLVLGAGVVHVAFENVKELADEN